MTSRESTRFLPLAHDDEDQFDRSLGDWAVQLGIGAIQWPWLLRSLRGGSKAEKARLLARLDLPYDALPNLGSWKADTSLLHRIVDRILEAKPKLVVEFGAGASSLIAARALQINGTGTLISFDQHAGFVEATRQWLGDHGLSADMRCVPLKPAPDPWDGLWYDFGSLPDGIDLLLIDGPCWTIHPFTRGGAATVFDRIAPGGMVMLDDGARPGERLVRRKWQKHFPDFDFRLVSEGTKGTVVGTRRA
ncbi:MAG: class I SAM-dependent methyltransferase [Parasphingopyxis sp.]|uniref:class I SAM-dependent methyltransferase n=1 Tax=Parasphingopyxis sp. TaxID=1920299 RepID=UPI0032ED730D